MNSEPATVKKFQLLKSILLTNQQSLAADGQCASAARDCWFVTVDDFNGARRDKLNN